MRASISPVLHSAARARTRRLPALLGAALLACGGGADQLPEPAAGGEAPAGQASASPAAPAPCADDNVGLTLPAGFCASLFAEGLGSPRHVAVRPNGDVFVVRRAGPAGAAGADGTAGGSGTPGVVALRDTTGDGRADVRVEFGPLGGTGILLRDGYLYVDAKEAILRYRVPEGALEPTGAPDTLVTGLPTGGHEAHTFVVDGRGNLLVNVGSRTNSCQRGDREPGSPGLDPCTELETRAGIWRFDANRTGQAFSPQQRWATGIRNAVAMTLDPAGRLWVAQHGRDNLLQNWPAHFDARQSAENPAEELQQVNEGDDFGWPYCYYSNEHARRVLAPDYGGNGRDVGRCTRYKDPVAALPGHWAPMSLLFYTGRQFPARFRDGVFIAFHGSWNRLPLPQAGFNVTFQPLRDGRAAGAHEVFADGFAGGTVMERSGATHRPVGLAQAPDGSILVTDDRGGRIYRISATGQR